MSNEFKCAYADEYKATKAPTCGCDVCETKWQLANSRRDKKDVNWEFCDDAEKSHISCGIMEAIENEGSVNLDLILKSQEQIDIVQDAIDTLLGFEKALEESDLIEYY